MVQVGSTKSQFQVLHSNVSYESSVTLLLHYDAHTILRYVIKPETITFMGLTNGLTRYSQTLNNIDDRWSLDEATASLFGIAEKAMV